MNEPLRRPARLFAMLGSLASLAACGSGDVEAVAPPAAAETAKAAPASSGAFRCTVTSITDGDTLRCAEREADGNQIRVRLSGIAARERDGSCSPGHPCPAATPEEAAGTLATIVEGRALECSDEGRTHGRRAAFCRRVSDGLDVSCAMLESGTVERWEEHWRRHRCS